MCMNCGCGELDERHGSDANITRDDVMQAARSTGQDVQETASHLRTSLDQLVGSAGSGTSQSSYGSSGPTSQDMGRSGI
ncbi:MAG: hypothetical protein U0838_05305 [Chloroflexota bacterium]